MKQIEYGKYMYGDDGYYGGAVIKPGEQSIIHHVVRRPAGEWAARIDQRDGSRFAFRIADYYPDDKTSLGELTRREFRETMRKLGNLERGAKKDLYECYMVLKMVYMVARTTDAFENPSLPEKTRGWQ